MQENRGNNNRKKLTWTLVCITVILILATIFVWYYYQDNKNLFIFSSNKEGKNSRLDEAKCLLKQFDRLLTRPTLKANNESTSLVNFEGYLYLDKDYFISNNEKQQQKQQTTSERHAYLPLELELVKQSNGPNGEQLLSLWTNCAIITLHIAANERELLVGSVDVETMFKDSHGTSHSLLCSIPSTPISLKHQFDHYYSCKFSIDFPCFSRQWTTRMVEYKTKKVASLRMQQIEFELNGNKSFINRAEFSKKPYNCAI